MTVLALILTCLAILVQVYGALSENECIGNEIIKIHRFKRNHATPVSDHNILNSTNHTKQGKADIKKIKEDDSNKIRGKPSPKRKPKVVKDEPKQTDSKINNIRPAEKFVGPTNKLHFIEDIDDDSPITHIQVKEHRLKEKPAITARVNETSKVTKPPKVTKDSIESLTKNVLPENSKHESQNELIPQLKTTVDPDDQEKPTVMLPSDLNGHSDSKGNLANTTKADVKDESIASIHKSSNNELYDQRNEPENSVIEIKEHKYEEEILRFCPTKSCQPNAKRHWDASQNFNPRFSNSRPYAQAMNPYQGLTQADPYQMDKRNKNKYYSAYTCANYKDPSNGLFFYANFDGPNERAGENRRFHGYGNYDRIRKTWRDINTKVRTPGRPDECLESINKDYTVSSE